MAKRRTKKVADCEDSTGLNESDILALATKKVFARGEALLDDGALLHATREEIENAHLLRASCCGSESEPYQVRALLGPGGVRETDCSCPYDYEGICKHVVALLLLQAREPDALASLTPLDEILDDLDRDDLVRFVRSWARRDFQTQVALNEFRLAKLSGEEFDELNELPSASELRSRARAD